MTVVDRICNNNEANYRKKVRQLVQSCKNSDLFLRMGEKKLVSTSGVQIHSIPHWPAMRLLWRVWNGPSSWGCTSLKTSPSLTPPCWPRRLKHASTSPTFWWEHGSHHLSCTLSTITVWYGSLPTSCLKILQPFVNPASKIISDPLPSLTGIIHTRLTRHPSHFLFGFCLATVVAFALLFMYISVSLLHLELCSKVYIP